MILIIPAVEIRAGRCVRTAQGVGELCYSDDPVEVARLWRIENAKSLHVTDLDGVREGRLVNAESVKRMVQTVDIPVELGGGVRTFEDARWAFETGVYRVLVSTMVIENPEEAQRLLSVYGPSKVVLAMYAVLGIVATHAHEDHIGANRLIQERFGINIYAHQEAIPLIGQRLPLFPYQEMVWGYPEPSTVLPIPSIIRTNRFIFEVIETPGHSKDHIVLVERSKGWCFSGDIFVNKTIKTIRQEEDMAITVNSLRRLAALKTNRLILLTALGRIFDNGREELKSFDSFIQDLAQKALKLKSRGYSVQEIMADLFGGEDPRASLTNNQFSTENLIRSVLMMK